MPTRDCEAGYGADTKKFKNEGHWVSEKPNFGLKIIGHWVRMLLLIFQ